MTLDAVSSARKAVPKSDGRVTISHAMLVGSALVVPEDFRRMKALDIMVQTTPHWAHDLGGTLELYSTLLDPKRGAHVMLTGDMWDSASLVAFGADYPATGLPFPKTSPL